MAIVPGPPSLSFLLACSLERGRHLWGIGGDDFCYPSDDEKRKGNVECVPGLFFKEIESRSSEGNGFGVYVCIGGCTTG